jgi:hypothetical protein
MSREVGQNLDVPEFKEGFLCESSAGGSNSQDESGQAKG